MPVSYSPPPLHDPHASASSASASGAGKGLRVLAALIIILAMMALGVLTGFSLTPDARKLLERPGTGRALGGMKTVRIANGMLTAPAGRMIRLGKSKEYALRLPVAGDDGQGGALTLIFSETKKALLPMRQRAAIYRHYMDGKPRRTPMGLAEYHFRAASPYGDVILYVGRKAGRIILISCRDQLSQSGIPACSSAFSPLPGLIVTYAFSRAQLKNWSRLDALAHQALAQYYQRG